MAEEFKNLPNYLQHASSVLVLKKQHRTIFICSLISLMAVTSVVGVLVCPTGRFIDPEIPIYDKLRQSSEKILDTPKNSSTLSNISPPGMEKLIVNVLKTALQHEANTGSVFSAFQDENKATISKNSEHLSRHRRRETYRFYRYKKHPGPRRHYKRFSPRQERIYHSRKILTINDTIVSDNGHVDADKNSSCLQPEYIVFTWILCLIALASALKLYYIVKTALASIIVSMYAILILIGRQNIFVAIKNPDE